MAYLYNALKEYIKNSELRVVNDRFRVRLSADLAKKYDNGVYKNALNLLISHIDAINSLKIKYPNGENPVFYMYIVPDKNFAELLAYPYKDRRGGGLPVDSFEKDGFSAAYGTSQNMLANHSETESVSQRENSIHEFAHMVHGMFFNTHLPILGEGFAEVIPLYSLKMEEQFDEHRNVIINMDDAQIFTVRDMYKMCQDGSFYTKNRVPNKSCSFDWSYISSYLFVRGYIMQIAKKFRINRLKATQKFLDIMYDIQRDGVGLFVDMAAVIDMQPDELIDSKKLQKIAKKDIEKISLILAREKVSAKSKYGLSLKPNSKEIGDR